MKTIQASAITAAVAELCIRANTVAGKDILAALRRAKASEETPTARNVIDTLEKNADIAAESGLPICQDTGMAVVFVEIGQEARVVGGLLSEAINAGVAKGYRDGYLRQSVVRDPIDRVNTSDNTPAVIHYEIVGGADLRLIVAPKGFGSENMSALKMLSPAEGLDGIRDFILETVRKAGSNPCPPVIVGVGVGGTMEKACLLAKRALLRPVGESSPDAFWAQTEAGLLQAINRLGIGPAGFGGRTTALGVHINVFPTHIAGLPVAVNIGCHVTRHAEVLL